ncbi:BAG family molecular chaperone regulator 4-like [Scleropages formosus]|uniref:BAG family molecular chaperone regulator 4-like n=1 Tax=Scleropages formosus TaxID=113540 RepID=A0A0P7VDV6_SCLFO|nr:BAG family molecular chaperone regulator 4 [Scleropages formosus]XP_018617943.1 BAG family molecular chaperone regulator 4 [Scleropages formosus]KPP73532.1 BAG family molecular chaperone regulator 4-like [Scleropages formosus]
MAYDSVRNDRSGGNAPWVHHMQPKGGWPANYSSSENNNWNSAMVTGTREAVPYPGYPSNYWYPPSHTAGPYSNAYPSRSEVNGQGAYNAQTMPGYPDAVYNPAQYPPGLLHPSNPFYCGNQPAPRQPPYPSQGCADQGAGASSQLPSQHCPYPVSHCQGAHGYPPAPYPHYGDGGHPLPQNSPYPHQQPLHPRPQPESWTHTGGYGHGAQSQWQPDAQPPQNHYGNPLISPHPLPAWTGSGAGSSVPQYDTQDQQYPGYPPRNQPMGPKPPPVNPGPGQKKEFSAPPQIHKTGKRQQEPKPSQDENPPAAPGGPPLSENPSLARVQQVMARVFLLQEDVDEFVGHKTDKSYRCLEELLTKELLELDSVETNGQESVRQARKVAVQKIQGILDQLEKKAF